MLMMGEAGQNTIVVWKSNNLRAGSRDGKDESKTARGGPEDWDI